MSEISSNIELNDYTSDEDDVDYMSDEEDYNIIRTEFSDYMNNEDNGFIPVIKSFIYICKTYFKAKANNELNNRDDSLEIPDREPLSKKNIKEIYELIYRGFKKIYKSYILTPEVKNIVENEIIPLFRKIIVLIAKYYLKENCEYHISKSPKIFPIGHKNYLERMEYNWDEDNYDCVYYEYVADIINEEDRNITIYDINEMHNNLTSKLQTLILL
jgi:hypothetical protein